MDIIQITSEYTSIAKVGGLADVVYGLSRELKKQGHSVKVLLPKYDCIDLSFLKHLTRVEKAFLVSEGDLFIQNFIWTCECEGVEVHLLEAHHPKNYFNRGHVYGSEDDCDRFFYFCRAALEYLSETQKKCILHTHDWPTALTIPLYRTTYASSGFNAKTVLTLHSIDHQGICSPSTLEKVGLKMEETLRDPLNLDLANILKGALIYADHITTVSPSYKQEILTQEGGKGLTSTLKNVKEKLSGILNGIDYDYWNPKTDPYLPFRYKNPVKGKARNKEFLQHTLQMNQRQETFLVGCVTRLVPQKGLHLIEYALKRTLELGGQFVLLGTSPIPEIDAHFQNLKKEYAKNKDVHLFLLRDESMARLIYASSDAFLIPSLFEPCGLTQMIAMRFGTVPIARNTGGLKDTVFDLSDNSESNGFTFDYPDEMGVKWALDRAFNTFYDEPKVWKKLIKRGMETDFSWEIPAAAYFKIYRSIRSLS